MTKICYWDAEAKEQKERDASPEEQAEIDARKLLPPVVPAAVTMRQARLALLQAGKLSAVNAAIAGMSGVQGEAAKIEWEFSNEVRRAQSLVAALAPVLGMTPAQIDQLFITAAGL